MRTLTSLCLGICVLFAAGCAQGAAPAAQNSSVQAQSPEDLFNRYVELEHAFDPAVADLYADTAIIRNTRMYPTGRKRTITIPAPKYKALIRKAMPLARARNDTSSYLDVTYAPEGTSVRIIGTRHSNLKNYDSPLSILVSPDGLGGWLITEEISQSQP